MKKFPKQKSSYTEKKRGEKVKKVRISDAILTVCDPKHFVFLTKNITEEMKEFLDMRKRIYPKTKTIRPCADFHDFSYRYWTKMTTNNYRDIDTELFMIRWSIVCDFYNDKINKHKYSMYHWVNKRRMLDVDELGFERAAMIVDTCSAGLWELKEENKPRGFSLIQHSLFLPTMMEIINHNQWITHNIGLVAKLNSMYKYKK